MSKNSSSQSDLFDQLGDQAARGSKVETSSEPPLPASTDLHPAIHPVVSSEAKRPRGRPRGLTSPLKKVVRAANGTEPADTTTNNSLDVPGRMHLSDREIANQFGVSRTTVWRLLRAEPLFAKPISIGGSTRWYLPDIIAFEERLRGGFGTPSKP